MVEEGETIGTRYLCAMGAAARLREEAFSPIRATTSSRVISFETADAASEGSLRSSSTSSSIRLPSVPPAWLTSSTASRAPFLPESANVACGPVSAPKKPILMPAAAGVFSAPQREPSTQDKADAARKSRRFTKQDSMRAWRVGGPTPVTGHLVS